MLIEYINPSYLSSTDDNQTQVWILNIGGGGVLTVGPVLVLLS